MSHSRDIIYLSGSGEECYASFLWRCAWIEAGDYDASQTTGAVLGLIVIPASRWFYDGQSRPVAGLGYMCKQRLLFAHFSVLR